MCIQHMPLCFHPVIPDELPGNAQPLPIRKGANLHLGIGLNLFGNVLHLSRLDIKSALKDVGSIGFTGDPLADICKERSGR